MARRPRGAQRLLMLLANLSTHGGLRLKAHGTGRTLKGLDGSTSNAPTISNFKATSDHFHRRWLDILTRSLSDLDVVASIFNSPSACIGARVPQ